MTPTEPVFHWAPEMCRLQLVLAGLLHPSLVFSPHTGFGLVTPVNQSVFVTSPSGPSMVTPVRSV